MANWKPFLSLRWRLPTHHCACGSKRQYSGQLGENGSGPAAGREVRKHQGTQEILSAEPIGALPGQEQNTRRAGRRNSAWVKTQVGMRHTGNQVEIAVLAVRNGG